VFHVKHATLLKFVDHAKYAIPHVTHAMTVKYVYLVKVHATLHKYAILVKYVCQDATHAMDVKYVYHVKEHVMFVNHATTAMGCVKHAKYVLYFKVEVIG